ncbi:unnamed protein product [Penicillium camemberti]|uniref:Str. FM013 n=1 Tax=Penicillium camemberti (strain FM 013) TaxID=1429867 RepID=A0A0G4PF43_PENC3|nr:unnamed protein product [Penicillium camemberti]
MIFDAVQLRLKLGWGLGPNSGTKHAAGAARVLCAAPEQDLHLYVVFRMSNPYGETKQVLS